MYVDGEYVCDTLEDKDRGLTSNMSVAQICGVKIKGETAIPTGRYLVDMKTVSPRFGGRPQYQFCKEYSLVLQKKGQNIQNTLAQKQHALEQAYGNFQQKVQQNAYTREQAEQIQMSLQKQNSDLQVLNQRLSGEFQSETEKYNNALRDSIQHFLAVYNSKAGDNILYADKAYDITNEVIAGLNKAYKPAAPAKDEKAAKKK